MNDRYLVTTALEETWPEEGPVLFLGEWCRRFSRRSRWGSMDGEVVPYHWSDRARLDSDHEELVCVYEWLLRSLGERLNESLDVDHGTRYWRLLIGPWLIRALQMALDRWRSLERVIAMDTPLTTVALDAGGNALVTSGLAEFQQLTSTDLGNHLFFSQLLAATDSSGVIGVRRRPLDGSVGAPPAEGAGPGGLSSEVWPALRAVLGRAWSRFGAAMVRSDDVLLYGTRFTRSGEALLAARLGQFPQTWDDVPDPPVSAVDLVLRERLVAELPVGTRLDGFEPVFASVLPEILPTTYLEGYGDLVGRVEELRWPAAPKAIWTSREWRDEVFKAYAADRVERGTRFVMSQPSGGYGMFPWDTYEERERAVSDRYLTWGWDDDEDDRVRPVGYVRKKRPLGVDHGAGQRALLVTVAFQAPVQMMTPMVNSSVWLEYFDDSRRFVDALDPDVRRSLLIRLYRSDSGWDQSERWAEHCPDVDLDDGKRGIDESLIDTRLVISTYNGANNLESMAMGIPTVMFWNPVWWPLRDSAQPYFDRLRDVGVFHESPTSAAVHVGSVWSDVEGWWKSESVVGAVSEFTDRFIARPSDLTSLLAGQIRASCVDDPLDC